jgi:hypothetical protein
MSALTGLLPDPEPPDPLELLLDPPDDSLEDAEPLLDGNDDDEPEGPLLPLLEADELDGSDELETELLGGIDEDGIDDDGPEDELDDEPLLLQLEELEDDPLDELLTLDELEQRSQQQHPAW